MADRFLQTAAECSFCLALWSHLLEEFHLGNLMYDLFSLFLPQDAHGLILWVHDNF